jgi:hypothetical protein
MSRHRQGPPITPYKSPAARFANAPRTPEYNKAIWDGIKRFAPDKIPALIDAAHDEALRLNQETR